MLSMQRFSTELAYAANISRKITTKKDNPCDINLSEHVLNRRENGLVSSSNR